MPADEPATRSRCDTEPMAAHDLVPTIDVASPSDAELAGVDAACRNHGFFLLTGHGLDALIDRTWAEARTFFESDREHRLAVQRDADNALGWYDRELTKRRRDHKQVFDFADPAVGRIDARNRWPDDGVFPEFRSTMVSFYDAFSELATRTAELVHAALGLSSGAEGYVGDRRSSAVRLNHYPLGDPVPADERDDLIELGETALGFHTDSGVLTLLLQDDTGGLQALAADGDWVDIEPRQGTIVVNLADAMQVWTNDQYRAATHRVLTMTDRDRMSIPYFSNPLRDRSIEPIPELANGAPRYRDFVWGDFIKARTADNFADLGVDDAQITDYLIDA